MKTSTVYRSLTRVFFPVLLTLSMVLFFSFGIKAQIIYTDINPDTVLAIGGSFDLDLDVDGLADFHYAITNDTIYPMIDISVLHDSSYVANYIVDGCGLAIPLSLNDSIAYAPYFTYRPEGYLIAFFGPSYCNHSGLFAGTEDKYMGFWIIRNGQNCYGWMRMDVSSDATRMRLKDYGYSCTGILAGQIINKIDDKTLESKIIVQRDGNHIIIKPTYNLEIIDASLINLTSRTSQLQVINNEVRIDNSNYAPGIYVVRLNTPEGGCTIKIMINQ